MLGACLGDAERVCLIMELVEGGNLAQRIYDRNKRRLTYLEILQVLAVALPCFSHAKLWSCSGFPCSGWMADRRPPS